MEHKTWPPLPHECEVIEFLKDVNSFSREWQQVCKNSCQINQILL